jgi:hypothetical protein
MKHSSPLDLAILIFLIVIYDSVKILYYFMNKQVFETQIWGYNKIRVALLQKVH